MASSAARPASMPSPRPIQLKAARAALRHAAERVDKLRIGRARGRHGAPRGCPFVRLGRDFGGTGISAQWTWPLYLMGGRPPGGSQAGGRTPINCHGAERALVHMVWAASPPQRGVRGSSASRKASPSTLTDTSTLTSTRPGRTVTHQMPAKIRS